MPAIANLVLTDRATTPVNHTFSPAGKGGNGEAVLKESSGVPIGEPQFTISLSKSAAGRYNAALKLTVPVLVNEIVNGVTRPSVDRAAVANVSFSFPPNSTAQERKDIVGMVQSSLDATKWTNDVLVNLNAPY